MRWGWKPYVPVAKRRANAARHAAKLLKKGEKVQPISIEGRAIARTFWGAAWCDNLEGYSDFANRLPRGRTYVRNGSVIDLKIHEGRVKAVVSGSRIYQVSISIKPVAAANWKQIIRSCSGSIDSLMDLLQGRFADAVMQKLTSQESGLFPTPNDISFDCSCPDWASMCKHVAAVLYGVGARLDEEPELLFILRNADHLELIAEATSAGTLDSTLQEGAGRALDPDDLESVFGVDLDPTDDSTSSPDATKPKTKSPRRKRARTRTPSRPKVASTAKKTLPTRREFNKQASSKKTRSATAAQSSPGNSAPAERATKKKTAKRAAKKKASHGKIGVKSPVVASSAEKAAKKRAAKKRTASGRTRRPRSAKQHAGKP